MKSKIISFLKIALPLSFGVFLIWLFYDALCPDDRKELFRAFGKANYFWVFLALVFSFLSHASRAYRWKYLLDPMGYKVTFWNAYHALMIGYIVNLVFPRAGEASRAGILAKSEKVPFQKGFGTILAERAVDVGMIGIIVLITLSLQVGKIDLFQAKMEMFNNGQIGCGNQVIFGVLGSIVKYGILLGLIVVVGLTIFKASFRNKIREFGKGLIEGILAVFRTKYKLHFIGHTLFIWLMYILMFSVCFYSVEETSMLGPDAMLAGFVAGTFGIVLVQGGIGVYPALVGLIVSAYLDPTASGILPEALALGWIIWTSQTILMITLGLISVGINAKNVKFAKDGMAETTTE